MKPRWWSLILSSVAFIVGIILLLVFIHFYTVPHVLTGDFLPTSCTLTDIQVGHINECLDRHGLHVNQSLRETQAYTFVHCARVSHPCVRARVSYNDGLGRTIHNALAYLDSWTYYQVKAGIRKCACPKCHVIAEKTQAAGKQIVGLQTGSWTYRLADDSVSCLYNPYDESEVLLNRSSTALVLNAMLWPTLLFIIGFVGVFFGCLFIQHERCEFLF